PSRNPIVRLVRNLTERQAMAVLNQIQPANGGFLEATPLTSFVVMSLAGSGYAQHAVTRKGVEFLIASARADGSWPIDTNLATWVTTLAVNALAKGPADSEMRNADRGVAGIPHSGFCIPHAESIRDWLLGQQY